MPPLLFYLLAAITLGFGLLVVLARNPVTSALSLASCFVGLAALFISLDAYFIGTIQVLVYAGAVMVLFLFIIMLLDAQPPGGAYPWKRALVGGAAFLLLAAAAVALLAPEGSLDKTAGSTPTELAANPETYATSAKAFGRSLYTKYMLPLQMAGLLLLLALVGVVTLAKAPKSAD